MPSSYGDKVRISPHDRRLKLTSDSLAEPALGWLEETGTGLQLIRSRNAIAWEDR
jgi:hypothetical protein